MQKITVTTSAVNLPFGDKARPLLQNLGPGDIYFAPDDAVSVNYGFKLPPGMGYEFPDNLGYGSGWMQVWVISTSTSDLRIGSVG